MNERIYRLLTKLGAIFLAPRRPLLFPLAESSKHVEVGSSLHCGRCLGYQSTIRRPLRLCSTLFWLNPLYYFHLGAKIIYIHLKKQQFPLRSDLVWTLKYFFPKAIHRQRHPSDLEKKPSPSTSFGGGDMVRLFHLWVRSMDSRGAHLFWVRKIRVLVF